ncbi:MAG: serine O-acetyltransferase [Solirubrobacterales bacterium]
MGYFKQDMEVWFGTNDWEPMDDFTFWRKTAVQFLVNPGVMAVAMHRMARWLYEKNLIFPSQVMDRLTEFFTGAQIPGQTEIGPGFRVYHPNGLVISPCSKLGKNACVHSDVVFGKSMGDWRIEAPIIGDDVTLGTGVKLLGQITLGSRVMVGANSVVLQDLPDDCIAAGIPAKVLKRTAPDAADVEESASASN